MASGALKPTKLRSSGRAKRSHLLAYSFKAALGLAVLSASLGLAGAVGCAVRPAQERAERDLEVGQASKHGVAISVDQGLAAVRRLEVEDGRGELTFWQSAPQTELSIKRESSAPTEWSLVFWNAPRDAELTLLGEGASIEALPGEIPTEKRYQVRITGGEARFRFASAQAGVSGPFSFGLLSDVQEAIDGVQDIFSAINQEPVAFLLGAGDLTQRGSHEELTRFQRELRRLNVPYYTTLGNHELGQSPTLWHEYFGRGSFNFSYRGAAFTLLDSGSATLDPMVYEWLDGWLKQHRNAFHVVSMHIPPLDPVGVRNGAFASRNEAAKLLRRLNQGGVDLTVYGHIHSLYSFENAGISAYISGGGGAIPERFDQIGRHFLVFDVDPSEGVRAVRTVRVD